MRGTCLTDECACVSNARARKFVQQGIARLRSRARDPALSTIARNRHEWPGKPGQGGL